jgi:hypothetical protein
MRSSFRASATFAVLSLVAIGAPACTADTSEGAESAELSSVVTATAPYRLRVELPPGVTAESVRKPAAFIAKDADREVASNYTSLVPGQSVALGAPEGCLRMPSLGYSEGALNCSLSLDRSNEKIVRLSKIQRLFAGEVLSFSSMFPVIRVEDNGAEYDEFYLSTYDLRSGVLFAPGRYRVKMWGSMGLEMVVPEGEADFHPNLDASSFVRTTTVKARPPRVAGVFPDAPNVSSAMKVVADYDAHRYSREAPLRQGVPVFVLPSSLPSLFQISVQAFGETITSAYWSKEPQMLEVDVHRLDVADVTVPGQGGAAPSRVPGRYTVARLGQDAETWMPLLDEDGTVVEMPTSTGLDVPAGSYKITVRFDGGGSSASIAEERYATFD